MQLDVTKYAVIYPRQSSSAQVDQNVHSTENQLRLRHRALADGFPEHNVLVIDDDLGVSGRSIEGRVGMKRALALIDQGLVGALYAEDQTRLSRDVDTIDHMTIAKKCRVARVPLYMGGSWRDMTDRGARLTYKVEAVIGSEMWGGHVEKMHAAARTKVLKGQYQQRAPRGYRKNTRVKRDHPDYHRLEPYEPEAEIIRDLAARLPDAGSLSKLYEATYPLYWPDGTLLKRCLLYQIFRKPVYRGVVAYDDIVVPDAHPALLTPDQAAYADRLKELNSLTERRRTSAPAAGGDLAGLVFCAECKRKAKTGKNRDEVGYRCQLQYVEDGRVTGAKNHHFATRAARIDAMVARDLWKQLEYRDLGGALVRHLEQQREQVASVVGIESKQLRVLERKRQGYLNVLGTPELDPEAIRMVTDQLAAVAREIEGMRRPAAKVAHVEADLARVRGLMAPGVLSAIHATWKTGTWTVKERRAFLREWIERVEVSRGPRMLTLTVHYKDGRSQRLRQDIRQRTSYGPRRDWSADERAVLLRLIEDPTRPARGWPVWAAARMAEAGYTRSASALYGRALEWGLFGAQR